MEITPERFDKALTILCKEYLDKHPEMGLFGPDSMMWKLSRESFLLNGAGCSVMLQNAHPVVGQGVLDHSNILKDPVGRYERTMNTMNKLIYGDRETVLETAKLLYRIHSNIKGILPSGEPYKANTLDALVWIACTALWTMVKMYNDYIERLSHSDILKLTSEFYKLMLCFGVTERELGKFPCNFFSGFVLERSKELHPTAEMIKTMKQMFTKYPYINWLNVPFTGVNLYLAFTGLLLPKTLRKAYRMRWTKLHAWLGKVFLRLFSWFYFMLPKRRRYMPAYLEAMAKIKEEEWG